MKNILTKQECEEILKVVALLSATSNPTGKLDISVVAPELVTHMRKDPEFKNYVLTLIESMTDVKLFAEDTSPEIAGPNEEELEEELEEAHDYALSMIADAFGQINNGNGFIVPPYSIEETEEILAAREVIESSNEDIVINDENYPALIARMNMFGADKDVIEGIMTLIFEVNSIEQIGDENSESTYSELELPSIEDIKEIAANGIEKTKELFASVKESEKVDTAKTLFSGFISEFKAVLNETKEEIKNITDEIKESELFDLNEDEEFMSCYGCEDADCELFDDEEGDYVSVFPDGYVARLSEKELTEYITLKIQFEELDDAVDYIFAHENLALNARLHLSDPNNGIIALSEFCEIWDGVIPATIG